MSGLRVPARLTRWVLLGFLAGASAGCAGSAPDVRPPVAPDRAAGPVAPPSAAEGVVAAPATAPATAAGSSGPAVQAGPAAPGADDPAVEALRAYLREQARAANAQDPTAAVFRATLTPAAQDWALPLLRANFGDLMPGPYPMGVLDVSRPSPAAARVSFCMQVRGWQVDRGTGRPVNSPHHSGGYADVELVQGTWLVADVVDEQTPCDAGRVVEERF
ncbi:hypothetical protein CLV92_101477 [Kineococcus xinjiangensis]|uniref:Lipoprotein n=1 Tax=Kineococcus xinjiangensis TaxID=512762 RepID=A0A2S6IWW4_9ACTN|nr:hypothetical protein [Kineococcus xinjiangensis]PPK98776.1 hypothetical protein CLV92_101477 [Kineococcus xinjiangensis]